MNWIGVFRPCFFPLDQMVFVAFCWYLMEIYAGRKWKKTQNTCIFFITFFGWSFMIRWSYYEDFLFWFHYAFIPIHSSHSFFILSSQLTKNIPLYCIPITTYKSNNKQTFHEAIKFRTSAPTSRGQSHIAELDDFSFHSKPVSLTQKKTTYQHINLFVVFFDYIFSRWWWWWKIRKNIELTFLKQLKLKIELISKKPKTKQKLLILTK